MCYHFVLNCDQAFIKEMASLSVQETYFLVCLGVLNYVYSSDPVFVANLATWFTQKNLVLHTATDLELIDVLQAGDTTGRQAIYGNGQLFRAFYNMHLL